MLAVLVDLLPVAVLVLDGARTAVFSNPAADRLVEGGRLFQRAASGAIELADRSQQPCFDAFIDSLLAAAPTRDGVLLEERFFVKRGLGPPASIIASVCPDFGAGPSAVLCVRAPGMDATLPGVSLRAMFGLTQAEAALANALVAGESLADYSRRRNVTMHTAKAHLKAVLAKTGTHKQAQLVRLLVTV